MGIEDAFLAVEGEKVSEYLLERSGEEVTTREVAEEFGLTSRAANKILGEFASEGLAEKTSHVPFSQDGTYQLNGATLGDYEDVVESARRNLY